MLYYHQPISEIEQQTASRLRQLYDAGCKREKRTAADTPSAAPAETEAERNKRVLLAAYKHQQAQQTQSKTRYTG